ncbi:MAG: hypothetical protein QOF83_1070, partial [Solirubrobacteraceae bacterium]|nr:hypothetical protein [Solirubrobacteraceae bacterium]
MPKSWLGLRHRDGGGIDMRRTRLTAGRAGATAPSLGTMPGAARSARRRVLVASGGGFLGFYLELSVIPY